MIRLKYILFLVSTMANCLISILTFAQNVEFTKENFPNNKDELKKAKRAINSGDLQYNMKRYPKTLPYYLDANKFNPNNAGLNMKIGHVYLNSSEKQKALPYLQKSYELDKDSDPIIIYYLARAYHLKMDWENATKNYEAYKLLANNKTKELLNDLKKKIEECKNGQELEKNPAHVEIENLGETVNSKFAEYCPLITADESEMIFTSRRDNTTGGKIDPRFNEYYEDLYITKNKNNNWSIAKNMPSPVNTEGHDATVGLSPDGQKLLIYIDDKGDGNIYECNLEGSKWSEPKKLDKTINSASKETSASFSPDGKKLYFISYRSGGIGGSDIYISEKKDEKWGEAQNLGKPVNTEYNEEAVYIHPDGKTLYFSSKGHNTMGGYDIFKSVLKDGKWSSPTNIGFPINTPSDDAFFVLSASGRHGYYSSTKPDGYGEKDLYRVTFLRDTTKKEEEPHLALLKGVITNKEGIPLEANIEIVDLEKDEVIATFKSNSATGNYLISLPAGKNYGITVSAEGHLFESEHIDLPESSVYQEKIEDFQLKKLAVGQKIVLNNIFYDYGKATLRNESKSELERLTRLMNDMNTLKIEISGHTDNHGSHDYNQKLSENRSKAVVDRLINSGIDKTRLVYKGYGETQPISTNDTEQGRQLNRRTEFTVISK